MEEIIIGKHTLESLTTGMYSDPFVIYREYIQNAADSLDEAVSAKIITDSEKQIIVEISRLDKIITIEDNGTGVLSSEVVQTLVSIGNSKKINQQSRGFRGIGRLSGLSYCTKISFETTAVGDSKATTIVFDARKMSDILSADNSSEMTAMDVLNSVYQVKTKDIGVSRHYFKVIMEGVDTTTDLLDMNAVKQYISQTAPVPYAPDFYWGREIMCRLKQNGYCVPQYNIILRKDGQEFPIYKPYKDDFFIDKKASVPDKIHNITIIQVRSGKDKILAIGWLAQTDFKGSIYDKNVKGIRMRKGNILVGDHQTLNAVFKDSRFNGWSIGEVFAISPKLIPNARRDDFEKNDDYYIFFEALEGIADTITKKIRSVSIQRNVALSRAIDKSDTIKNEAQEAMISGLTRKQKRSLQGKLTNAKAAVRDTQPHTAEEQNHREIAFDELDMLIGQVKGITSFKAINALNGVTNTEKKILERVFNAIVATADDHADNMIEAIVNEFSQK